MKATFNTLLALGLVFTMASCGSETPDASTDTNSETVETAKAQGDNMPVINVTLNDGQRWKANSETTETIREMQSALENFSQQGTSRESMNKEISEKLMYYFDQIFQTTTMKGEAKIQLEKYLQPMKVYFDDLNSGDAEKARNSIEKFRYHLKAYDSYFE